MYACKTVDKIEIEIVCKVSSVCVCVWMGVCFVCVCVFVHFKAPPVPINERASLCLSDCAYHWLRHRVMQR